MNDKGGKKEGGGEVKSFSGESKVVVSFRIRGLAERY